MEQRQPDPVLARIGRTLLERRHLLGLSHAIIEEATMIRVKYLSALEEGRLADLPVEVYLKGFLRTYGNYLGLDGVSLAAEFSDAGRCPDAGPALYDNSRRSVVWRSFQWIRRSVW